MSDIKSIVVPKAGDITALSQADQKLAEVKKKYAKVPDFSTSEGYESGKKAIREMVTLRTGTDKGRKAITEPYRDFVQQVNDYAKSLISEVETLEQPFKDAKAEVDERAEREKQERITKLREKLEKEVTAFLDTAAGMDAASLSDLIDAAEQIDTEGYYDVSKEAEAEKARVIQRLNDMHDTAIKEESLEAEREQLRREREELERMRAEAAAAQAKSQPEVEQIRREAHKVLESVFDDENSEAEKTGHSTQTVMPSWLAHHAAADETEATPYDNAMEDLGTVGLSVTQAADVLAAIQAGKVRSVTFNGEQS